MKRKFKNIGYVILTLIITVTAFVLYLHREQNIDFGSMIPTSFKYCGRNIKSTDAEYIQLLNWLKNNKNGWVNTPASYISNNIYESNQATIIILNHLGFYSPQLAANIGE